MNGTLTVEEGSLYDFLDLIGRNIGALEGHPLQAVQLELGRLLRLIHTYNTIGRAQKNVAHHYDLSDTLYDLFLDKDRQYSCAYFMTDNNSLEEAQKIGRASGRERVRQCVEITWGAESLNKKNIHNT